MVPLPKLYPLAKILKIGHPKRASTQPSWWRWWLSHTLLTTVTGRMASSICRNTATKWMKYRCSTSYDQRSIKHMEKTAATDNRQFSIISAGHVPLWCRRAEIGQLLTKMLHWWFCPVGWGGFHELVPFADLENRSMSWKYSGLAMSDSTSHYRRVFAKATRQRNSLNSLHPDKHLNQLNSVNNPPTPKHLLWDYILII